MVLKVLEVAKFGCKGTTKFADLQILCRKSFRSTKSKVFSCGRNRKAKLMSGKVRNNQIGFEEKEKQKYNKERRALACRFEFLQN